MWKGWEAGPVPNCRKSSLKNISMSLSFFKIHHKSLTPSSTSKDCYFQILLKAVPWLNRMRCFIQRVSQSHNLGGVFIWATHVPHRKAPEKGRWVTFIQAKCYPIMFHRALGMATLVQLSDFVKSNLNRSPHSTTLGMAVLTVLSSVSKTLIHSPSCYCCYSD